MGIAIKAVGNLVSKFNSKGATLLRKNMNLNVKAAVKEGLKVPQGAKTYDAVRVGRNFKPDESYTDIFTFRDDAGNIMSRYTKKVDGNNIVEQKKGFQNVDPWEKDLDIYGNEVMNINARKVRSYTRENGKISKISEDFFATTDEPKPFLTHFKREIQPAGEEIYRQANIENILLAERRNGEKAKFIKNKYMTDKFAIGKFNLLETEASSPELKKIANNSYLFPYVSNDHKFLYRMADANIQDASFYVTDPDVKLFKEASGYHGHCSYSGKVYINLKSSKDLLRPRISLTEAIGHEVGHAKWDENCNLYDIYRAGIDEDDFFVKRFSKSEIADIKKYDYSSKHYITADENMEGYLSQFCEKIARKEGTTSAKKYAKLENDLNKQFTNMHGYQFYEPDFYEDDMDGMITFLRTLKGV